MFESICLVLGGFEILAAALMMAFPTLFPPAIIWVFASIGILTMGLGIIRLRNDIWGWLLDRALARSGRAPSAPDYTIWDRVETFTLKQAAMIFAGQHPDSNLANDAFAAWLRVLKDACRKGQVKYKPNDSDPAMASTTTRTEIKKFGEMQNERPPFFFPEQRKPG